MPRKEFTHPVGGSGGTPIDVSSVDSIETDEYRSGEAVVSETYPIEIQPTEITIIEELNLFEIPADKQLEITTEDGEVISGIEPRGSTGSLNTLEMTEIVITDPEASGGKTSLLYVGD